MAESLIERLICDKDFAYLQPYFYNNPHALRCELGVGNEKVYISNAKKRAEDIFNILFPDGADAIIFDYWITDHSSCGDADDDCDVDACIEYAVESEAQQLRFLLEHQSRYRHYAVSVPTYSDADEEQPGKIRRSRIVCYGDGKGFDYDALIERQISGNGFGVGFVSFENECIMSVYDDRGCDIVFAVYEKMKEYYKKLEPYFLEYDLEEMERRLKG